MKEFLALVAQQLAKGQPESLQEQLAEGLRKAQAEWGDLEARVEALKSHAFRMLLQ